MDKAAMAEVIKRELSRAQTWDTEQWEPARITGLQYYKGELPAPPSDADLSGAVSTDVADMCEAVLAQMQPAFTGAPPIEFEPEGPDDETQAAAETYFCHRALSRNGQDFVAGTSGLRDAMLNRAGILKVWTDEREIVEIATFEDVPAEDLGMILQSDDPLHTREWLNAEDAEQDADGMIEQVKVRITTTARQLKFDAVAPENFRLWADWQRPTLEGCPFQAERKVFVRGELYGLGIDPATVMALPAMETSIDQTKAERGTEQQDTRPSDPELDQVELWDVYLMRDWKEGGEIYNCLYSASFDESGKAGPGEAIVSDSEAVDFTPYAAGQIILQPHQFLGLSLADKIGPHQVAKSEVLRQWLDNLAYLNNGRLIVVEGGADPVNVENNNKPGGVITSRMKGGVEAIIGPDASQSAMAAMNWLDKSRGEAGGASLDMQTAGAQVKGETWRGIERQYGAKELLAGLMLRTFAETALREVYLLAHKNLRAYPQGIMQGKLRGEWIEQDASEWRPRSLANVQVGVAGSQMQERANSLRETIDYQMKALGAGQGGVLTDMANVYQALTALERAKGLEMPERYWIDPSSKGAQEAAAQKAQQAEQQSKAETQLIERISAIQVALQAWEKRLDASVKYFETVVKAEVEQMKVEGAATAQLEALQTSGLIAAAATTPKQSPAEEAAAALGGVGGSQGEPVPGAQPGAQPGGM